MDSSERKVVGAVAGMLAAVAPAWERWDDDNNRRLNVERDRLDSTQQKLDKLINSGLMLRLRLPAVMDFTVGLGLSNPLSLFDEVLPANVSRSRPNLFDDTVTAIGDISWPPKVGEYNEKGKTKEAGDLATLALGLTFEEARATLLGLLQDKQPNRKQKHQIFRAFNSLVATLYETHLDMDEFRAAWARVFGKAGSGDANTDPHANTKTPPTIQSTDVTIQSVIPLGLPELVGSSYAHLNTDKAMKFRLTVGSGNVNANTTLFTVQFGLPYTLQGQAYQPVPSCNYLPFYITNVTNQTFQVRCLTALYAGQAIDFGITTVSP